MAAPSYSQGTIKAAEDFDAERQAEFLRKSMRGIGTDERRIIQILTSHNNEQRQEISAKYKTMYGRDLVDDLKSELSGCFEDAVVALLVPSRKYDAICLNQWKEKCNSDERILIEILCPRSNQDIATIKAEYKKLYNNDLDEAVSGDMFVTGDSKRVLVAQLNGNREEDPTIDEEKVKKDAQDLYDLYDRQPPAAGEGQLGTDESVFNKVLCTRSFPHLRQVFEEYKQVAGKDIRDSIKSETSDLFYQFSLLAIVDWTNDSPSYYATRLHDTMVGAGTDDDQLIRLLVSHSEMDLQGIRDRYFEKYNKSLRQVVEDDTSGDYKKLLVAIVEGGNTPP